MGVSAKHRLLFVCTGNICRSPMAEYLLRHRLRRQSPWVIASAGLMAMAGMAASDEAVQVLRRQGIDLRPHRSRPLTRADVDAATVIVVMTRTHRDQLLASFPDAGDRVYLLKTFDPDAPDADLHDPIGQPLDVYRRTSEDIRAALPGLLRYMQTFEAPKDTP